MAFKGFSFIAIEKSLIFKLKFKREHNICHIEVLGMMNGLEKTLFMCTLIYCSSEYRLYYYANIFY